MENSWLFERAIRELMNTASLIVIDGCHSNPLYAEAMKLAFGDAVRARARNDSAAALKFLGAFWDIHQGWIDNEPGYEQRAKNHLAELGGTPA